DKWAVSVRLWYDTNSAQTAAFQAIKKVFPKEADKLQEANVKGLEVAEFEFAVTDPGVRKGEWKVTNKPGTAMSYTLSIPADTEKEADAIKEWLKSSSAEIKCKYTYGTWKVQQNARTVTLELLQMTDLQAKLDGIPKKDKGMVYVHRDALRQLAERIS